MNINPSKWHWSQWLATLMFLIYMRINFSVTLLYPQSQGIIGGTIINKIFTGFIPFCIALAILITSLIVQAYVYGFYCDATEEYILTRLAIPAGIVLVSGFLLFTFSMPLKMLFSWKNYGFSILICALYLLSVYNCYKKVEFRMVDYADLEQLEQDMKEQAKRLKGGF